MKKFFSLMLVALLLVSVLPFQAFAAGATPKVTVIIKQDGTEVTQKQIDVPSAGLTLNKALAEQVVNNWTNREYVSWTETDGSPASTLSYSGVANAGGYTVVLNLKTPPCTHANQITDNTATCTNNGQKTIKCEDCGEVLSTEAVAKTGHTDNAGVVTKEATCKEAGVKTYSCTVCGTTTRTEAIAKLTEHTYENNVCTVCGLTRYVLNFFNEKGTNEMKVVCSGDIVTAPTADLVSNYEFKGWYEGPRGYGKQFVSGSAWRTGDPTDWYAWYVYNPNMDGMSTINVTARCYVDGLSNSYFDVPVLSQAVADNTNVFDWLTANKNTTILEAVYAKVDTNKYEWKNRYFYNHNGTEVLTAQTTFADGSKSILIKLEEKDNTTRANVQLYLHSSSTSENPFRILDMNGYTSGMNVTREAAAKLVKEYYSYKNIGNLYTDSDWNELMNGENNNGRTSVPIIDNGTYKIHVVVTNASTKTNSNADTSNPKTGDYIMIAVGTMVLAAAAVVTLAEMKKRKMI